MRLILDAAVLEQYIDALVRQLELLNTMDSAKTPVLRKKGESSVRNGIRAIIDSLTLGCPSCQTAIDPNPDGCVAMRCASCSQYFCLLCFSEQPDSITCHSHARVCPNNPSKNMFASPSIREAAHRELQVEAVRKVLRETFGSNWREVGASRGLVRGAKKVLKQSGIDESIIFKSIGHDTARLTPAVGGTRSQLRHEAYFTFCVGFLAALVLAYYFHHIATNVSITTDTSDSMLTEWKQLDTNIDDEKSVINTIQYDGAENNPPSRGWWLGRVFVYLLTGLGLSVIAYPFLKNKPADVRDVVMTAVVLLWYPCWLVLLFIRSIFVYIAILTCLVVMVYILPKGNMTAQARKESYLFTASVLVIITFVFIYLPSAAGSYTAYFSFYFCLVSLPLGWIMWYS